MTLAKTPRLKSLQVQGHEAYLTIDPQGNPAGTLYQVDMAHAGGPFARRSRARLSLWSSLV